MTPAAWFFLALFVGSVFGAYVLLQLLKPIRCVNCLDTGRYLTTDGHQRTCRCRKLTN